MRRTLCLPVYPPSLRLDAPVISWPSPAISYSALVLVFWFWGDALLGFSLHVLHIVIEILELGLEHLLESLFHLHGHTAQMWTAWIGLTLILTLCMFSYRQARRLLAAHFHSWQHFRQCARHWVTGHWEQVSLPLVTLVLSVVFF
jgi:hypothetical protein